MCARYLRHATGNRSNSVFSLLLLFSLWLYAYTHARTHARTHTLIFFSFFYVWLCIDEIVHIYRTWLQTADVYSFLGNLRFQSADEKIRGRAMTRNVHFPFYNTFVCEGCRNIKTVHKDTKLHKHPQSTFYSDRIYLLVLHNTIDNN